jgi:hypothetical protein
LGDYFKLELGKNSGVWCSLKKELKGFFKQSLFGDFTTS